LAGFEVTLYGRIWVTPEGEHGGEPSSVQFCYRVGMDYVSCSPFRVPIARLAAAQAAISGDSSETSRTK
jgi:pyruvate,orthophosphate dikinase